MRRDSVNLEGGNATVRERVETEEEHAPSRSRFCQLRNALRNPRIFGLIVLLLISLFVCYAWGVENNPPAFYLDESSIAYNAHTISESGRDEYGVRWPLYFRAFGEYKNPVYIYLLAGLFRMFGPSILTARLLSIVAAVVAAVLMGILAARLSENEDKRWMTGLIVGLTMMWTPWFFEIGRLVFEVALYPLALVLFLLAVRRARERSRWSWFDCAALAASLALLTYTYSIGRLLAPLLAAGLILFATRERRRGLIKTWMLYGVSLIPLVVFSVRHPGALTARFFEESYTGTETSALRIVAKFFARTVAPLDPVRLFVTGDPNLRHHVPAMGEMLVAAGALTIIGLGIVVKRHRRDEWWRFICYGLLVSILPNALTNDRFHALRLIAFPVFLMILIVPALDWLRERHEGKLRARALAALLILMLLQAVIFQFIFHHRGAERIETFDGAYPQILAAAVAAAKDERVIYLADRRRFPSYIHAYWYATTDDTIHSTRFVHLDAGEEPPPGALVLGTREPCANCRVIARRGVFSAFVVEPQR